MIRVLTATLLVAGIAAPVAAQTPDVFRIGAINMSYIARTSKAGQSALAEIETFVTGKEADAVSRAAELDQQRVDVQRRSTGVSERARGDLEKAFEKSRLELRICEYEVRSIASPISSTVARRRLSRTARVTGSGGRGSAAMRDGRVRPAGRQGRRAGPVKPDASGRSGS